MATDHPLSFRILLYRYLFFGWLFQDVNRGNVFERSAAWRHNLDRAHWLVTYLRRWVALGIVSFALGMLVEHGLSAQAMSAFFYVPSVLSVVVNGVIGVLIAAFKLLPAPF
ncbi:MAG: hypothetical protein KA422_07135 [Rhizobacter sp.]|nr:hypothetical protein [Rhizobacter sp.]